MDATDTLTPRDLTADDLPALMALVREAGWNQTPEDWRGMLARGKGRGLADCTDRIIASALTLPYGATLGWIGMVLVAGEWRKRGCATRLLKDCIAELRGAGRVAGLDATPAGRPVYEKLGFAGSRGIARWRRPASAPSGGITPGTRLAGPGDLDRITALDGACFGAPRPALIRDLCARAEPIGWVAGEDAFLLHRAGLKARQIGPICAPDLATAGQLLDSALAAFGEALVIDACETRSGFDALLEARGFAVERRFTRMYLGAPAPTGDPERLFAIAGPELG
ncbi:GNAT family N-acetyltransferase [Frigidibacter sp. ROC022]|uniref:GNAT family N-acetyltransferase n=1 Tax=Frigidibacter sp. ROC022 TaxID=2971796 RepID=UPI00215AEA34|nr:GNAT family N-acetyltransferase [Frigidibacter sp. ROC022]MCR8723165.1 GNAT family N-acetyltransferase [Frigidibacter sp. ROC022]